MYIVQIDVSKSFRVVHRKSYPLRHGLVALATFQSLIAVIDQVDGLLLFHFEEHTSELSLRGRFNVPGVISCVAILNEQFIVISDKLGSVGVIKSDGKDKLECVSWYSLGETVSQIKSYGDHFFASTLLGSVYLFLNISKRDFDCFSMNEEKLLSSSGMRDFSEDYLDQRTSGHVYTRNIVDLDLLQSDDLRMLVQDLSFHERIHRVIQRIYLLLASLPKEMNTREELCVHL